MIYDRVLTVCTLDTEAEPRCLRPGRRYYFGESTVGVTRYYAALQAGERVDIAAEMWPAPISAEQFCLVDGAQYRIVQIQRKENSDGLHVQLLSLRLSETVFPVEEAKHDTDS